VEVPALAAPPRSLGMDCVGGEAVACPYSVAFAARDGGNSGGVAAAVAVVAVVAVVAAAAAAVEQSEGHRSPVAGVEATGAVALAAAVVAAGLLPAGPGLEAVAALLGSPGRGCVGDAELAYR
jgi:hypothetical protein